MIVNCSFITLLSSTLPVIVSRYSDSNSIQGFVIILSISIFSVVTVVWFFGLDKNKRTMLIEFMKNKFKKAI